MPPDETIPISTHVDLKTLEGGARPALVVMTGKQLGKKFDLVKDEAIIGRSRDCEIPLEDEDISRNHARLLVEQDGRVKVIDLGSTNGTFINKKQVKEAWLENGDQLRCGNTIRCPVQPDMIRSMRSTLNVGWSCASPTKRTRRLASGWQTRIVTPLSFSPQPQLT